MNSRNILTKLIFSVISATMILFIIWFMIGWVEKGDEIFSMHLDVQQTFAQINGINFMGDGNTTFMEVLRNCRNIISKVTNSGILSKLVANVTTNGGEISSGLGVFLTAVESIVNPIFAIAQSIIVLGCLLVIVVEILFIFLNFTLSLGEVLISPVFVESTINLIKNSILLI